MTDQKTKQTKYTKISLILDFLKGSKHFFVISILSAMTVTALDMLSPQLIRTTVDSIIGNEELKLPGFVIGWIERIGGVEFLRSHIWVIGCMIAGIALVPLRCPDQRGCGETG